MHLDDWVCFWKIHVFHTIILWTFSENCWACCRCSDSIHLHVWIIMDSARSWISKFSMIFRWSYFPSNRNLSYFVLSIVFILDAVTSVRWLPQTCIAFICIVKNSTKFCKKKNQQWIFKICNFVISSNECFAYLVKFEIHYGFRGKKK